MIPTILTKRIYEAYDKADGQRILVDRLWPRGIKKEDAHITTWAKSIAPSNEIRKAFGHNPDHWQAFKKQYLRELQENKEVRPFVTEWKDYATITLLYAAKDEKHNQALVLKEYLEKSFKEIE